MCRLLGYATSGFNLSLNDVLGMHEVTDFRDLSEIHNDGWGVALLSNPTELPFAAGEVRKPETGTKLYKSTLAARHDPIFRDFADDPARGGLWHLRLASSNLPLILENQHPFFANGLSFIHNGGRSDSAIFFSVILEYIAFGFALDEAVAQAVRQLRQAYPKSSYNCMIQSQDQLVALCAAGREKTSPRIVEIYDEYGKGEKAHDYRVMRYRDVQDRDGKPSGVVVASSGFEQNESDGWKVLENDQMIVASNRTGECHVRSI